MAKLSGNPSKSVWILVLVSGICFLRGLETKKIIKSDLKGDSANSLFREQIMTSNDEPSMFLTNKAPKNVKEIVQFEKNEKSLESEGTFNDEDIKPAEGAVNVEALKAADFSDDRESKLSWKNIIDAPPKQCPPGQRKDKNGRCRVILN